MTSGDDAPPPHPPSAAPDETVPVAREDTTRLPPAPPSRTGDPRRPSPSAAAPTPPARRRTGTRASAVVAVATVLVGLALYVARTDWRLLLWAEYAIVVLAPVAVATALRGHGGTTVVVGAVAVATHGETWLASLQGTVEGAVRRSDATDLLAWPLVGQNGSETLVVLGGAVAIAAGVRLAAARDWNQRRR